MRTKFEFSKSNIIYLDSEANQIVLYRNDKALYALKGEIKYIINTDKKGNIISIVFKIKDVFQHIYFIAFTETESFIRNSISTISSFLVKFNKDEKILCKKIEEL